MIERDGQVITQMLPNVEHERLSQLSKVPSYLAPWFIPMNMRYTAVWKPGVFHIKVFAGSGEYARDEGGDGFQEVHVNTIEVFLAIPSFLVAASPWLSQVICQSIWAFSSSSIM